MSRSTPTVAGAGAVGRVHRPDPPCQEWGTSDPVPSLKELWETKTLCRPRSTPESVKIRPMLVHWLPEPKDPSAVDRMRDSCSRGSAVRAHVHTPCGPGQGWPFAFPEIRSFHLGTCYEYLLRYPFLMKDCDECHG